MRWRLVRAGDVVLDPNGTPWMVEAAYTSGWAQVHGRNHDPDQTVRVLVPWPEAASILALREALGPVHVLDRNEVA